MIREQKKTGLSVPNSLWAAALLLSPVCLIRACIRKTYRTTRRSEGKWKSRPSHVCEEEAVPLIKARAIMSPTCLQKQGSNLLLNYPPCPDPAGLRDGQELLRLRSALTWFQYINPTETVTLCKRSEHPGSQHGQSAPLPESNGEDWLLTYTFLFTCYMKRFRADQGLLSLYLLQ